MSEIKHAADCNCHECEPYDEWTLTTERVTPHSLCCSECRELRAQHERLAADQPEISSIGTPGLEVLTWRGKTYVESHRSFLS